MTQVQALSGLGGIGKTQTAIEYAYRYADTYQAILWLRGEARDVLFSDVGALTEAFHLIDQDEAAEKQHSAVESIKGWLYGHSEWLLIIDNLEELGLLREMLPAKSSGHIILTTRAQFTGPRIQRLDLETMEPDEGALLLLRRAKRIGPRDTFAQASPTDCVVARTISQRMDGLPLALDQAGAYIEETGCSLSHYTAGTLNALGRCFLEQRQRTEAEPLLHQAFEICQKVLGAENPDTVTARQDLDTLGVSCHGL